MGMARTMEVSAGRNHDRRPEPRSTRVIVRKVGPWSVLKFSLLFYFCVMLVVLLALIILYQVLASVGVIESFEDFLSELFATGDERFTVNGRWLFNWAFYIGIFFVIMGSLINLFISFLYNLISDVVGGVEVTLTEKRAA
jgi:Transmembrane domain of unknown function (DUF3566)